jgi:hypothetical protein
LTPVVGAGFLGIEHFTPPWDVFFLPLFNLLITSYRLIFSDFALAIIVFTIVIRTLLAPALRAADQVAEGDAADGAAHPRGEPQAQGATGPRSRRRPRRSTASMA